MRTVLHHLLQELNDHLGSGAHQHLALAALLSIEDAAQAVVEHRDTNHGSCAWRAGKESSARGVGDAQPLRPAGNPCPALSRRSASSDARQRHLPRARGESSHLRVKSFPFLGGLREIMAECLDRP